MTIQRTKLRVALATLVLVCTTLHGVYADCVDDTEYRFLKIGTNRLGRCKYLTRKDQWKRRSLYCDTANADGVLVKDGCPAACRNCPDVCKDSAQRIEIKNWKGETINKFCAWFSRRPDTNRKWKYCQDLAVQAHCPVTCSTCPPSAPVAPTPSPVASPTLAPVISPTLAPVVSPGTPAPTPAPVATPDTPTPVPTPVPTPAPTSAPTPSSPALCPDNNTFEITLMNMGSNTAYDAVFASAKARWESIIKCDLSDRPARSGDSSAVDDVVIGYEFKYIDGTSSVLGFA